ncbi:MAG: glycosyltransferase family 2 protein [Cyclobacteriaceae bacterium]
MSNPSFSLIIPTYNRAEHILNAVNSVLNQTFPNFQIIIVDDGSTDNTQQVLSEINDSRVEIYYKINEERGVARNYGISKAVGDYISFLDSDDELYVDYLQTAIESIEELQKPEILHTDYEYRDVVGGRIIPRRMKLPKLLNDHLLSNSEIGVIGVFVRRDILTNYQFIAHRSAIMAEDLYLWLTLASRYKFHHVSRVTSVVGLHKDRSLNDTNAFKFLKSTLLIVRALSNDRTFVKYYSKRRVDYFFAKSIVSVALLYAQEGNVSRSFRLLKKGIAYSWRITLNNTFLATTRIIMIKSLKTKT